MSAISDFLDEVYVEELYRNDSLTLEVFDYIPLVSTVSGIARSIFGIFESIFGLISLPFELCGRVAGQKSPLFLTDGIANIIRGMIAMEPIGGNIILFLYDHALLFKHDFRKAVGLEMGTDRIIRFHKQH